ncbi:acyl-CoA dehydrogenase family protein [Pleionea sediminis]|uniref:acyl-CoA dehydrogenase family protein n=1 Tax=Pleionea sediminis TaxID=2569479 RepID=UPI001184DF23|nr:acyl-CoA dehydrogenase family protein [Pleionea sediminis]
MTYKAPVEDMAFILKDVFDVQKEFEGIEQFQDFDYELYSAVLEEGAKFAENVLYPLNRDGDEEGCHHEGNEVTTPKGFKEAYAQFCEGGWQGINGDPEFGGQGLPKSLHVLVEEMLYASNTSFTLYPSLTAGACAALAAHGSVELKKTYLENMQSGVWSGSMCLTEPHSGSDLGILKTKAEPAEDGTFKISGTKIFITGGEHDLADNIIHLVLARLPDAPAGPRGISLFLVPKFHVKNDGSVGDRNTVFCGSIEHKMGIKASSTCVMNFEEATGYLIGEPHRGLACMFTMMNKERLSIALQGVGLADVSYQTARQYAEERIQGRSSREGKKGASIIEHADVRRMLLSMRSVTEICRALGVYLGMQIDLNEHSKDAAIKAKAGKRVALLTPIAKAFFTDTGFENCNHGIQVLGGHGYVREWGLEQFARDARIAQIYEGTNGIQAQDLMIRKVCADNGEAIDEMFAEIRETIAQGKSGEYAQLSSELEQELAKVDALTKELMEQNKTDGAAAQGGAVEYLNAVAYVIGGWLWMKQLLASEVLTQEQVARKRVAAEFYFAHLMPKVDAYVRSIKNGYKATFELEDALI